MAPLTAGFWPFGYPASGPKYATPRTSRPPRVFKNMEEADEYLYAMQEKEIEKHEL